MVLRAIKMTVLMKKISTSDLNRGITQFIRANFMLKVHTMFKQIILEEALGLNNSNKTKKSKESGRELIRKNLSSINRKK